MFAKRPDTSSQPTTQPAVAAPGQEATIELRAAAATPHNAGQSSSPVGSTQPARNSGFQTPQRTRTGDVLSESVISNDLTIYGNVASRGRIRLEGKIEGELECDAVEVGETGTVEGGIRAKEVQVRGKVSGTIEGGNVMLFSSAHVEGDIRHQGIGIEMGTHYDGRLTWDKTADPSKSADNSD